MLTSGSHDTPGAEKDRRDAGQKAHCIYADIAQQHGTAWDKELVQLVPGGTQHT